MFQLDYGLYHTVGVKKGWDGALLGVKCCCSVLKIIVKSHTFFELACLKKKKAEKKVGMTV